VRIKVLSSGQYLEFEKVEVISKNSIPNSKAISQSIAFGGRHVRLEVGRARFEL
jgi:hypothetical protein